jgi:hypothetical protein
MLCAFPFQFLHVAVQLASVLVLDLGYLDQAPHILLALVPADQHAEQLAGVEAVGLFSTPLPFHLDARRIDHLIVDSMNLQKTV